MNKFFEKLLSNFDKFLSNLMNKQIIINGFGSKYYDIIEKNL